MSLHRIGIQSHTVAQRCKECYNINNQFKFEVIDEFKNKRSLKYYELAYQVQHNVLTSCVEGSDNHKYYNNYIGGKFFRPVERKEVKDVSKGSNVQHSTS